MSPMLAKRDNDDFPPRELIPAGLCHAVCYSIVDFGTVHDAYLGKPRKRHMICITWEIPEYRIDIEKDGVPINAPRIKSMTYNLSLGEKATLFKHLTSWRGKAFTPEELEGFDISKLLGVNCTLNIVHEPSTKDPTKLYDNIVSISPKMKNQQTLVPENNKIYYFMGEHFMNIPKDVPKWQRTEIAKSPEWKAMESGKKMGQGNDPTEDELNAALGGGSDYEPPADESEIPF
jgi:hypothetical protein